MKKNRDDVFSFRRVPPEARMRLIDVTLVRIGMATALSQFMIGATLGHGMSFWQAMLATLMGSLVLEVISLGLGIAGMREGLATSMLARYCGFGRLGSALISALLALSLFGWFGIQNSVLAEALLLAMGNLISFQWAAALSGLMVTVLVAFGFKALSMTAKISVPLFCFVVGWLIYPLLKSEDIYHFTSSPPLGCPISLNEGTTIISGVVIIGAIITPDLSRYCRNERHVFWMITLSVIVGEFIINAIAVVIAHSLGTADVVTIMNQSAGWIGLLSVILSAIKVNDINLYSSSLGLTQVIDAISNKKLNYFWLTIILGTIGTSLSVLGMLDHFIDFLVMLGVLFPPIAGIMLVDYYVLGTYRDLLYYTRLNGTLPDAVSTPNIGWPAILAWIVGALTGFTIDYGIPSINSLCVASVLYWLICKFTSSQKKSKPCG